MILALGVGDANGGILSTVPPANNPLYQHNDVRHRAIYCWLLRRELRRTEEIEEALNHTQSVRFGSIPKVCATPVDVRSPLHSPAFKKTKEKRTLVTSPGFANCREYNHAGLLKCHGLPFASARIEYQDSTPSVWRRVCVANCKPMSKWCEATTENLRFSLTATLSLTGARRHFSGCCRPAERSSRGSGIPSEWSMSANPRLVTSVVRRDFSLGPCGPKSHGSAGLLAVVQQRECTCRILERDREF